jgi:3-methyladenine DNA glycosylase AlkC
MKGQAMFEPGSSFSAVINERTVKGLGLLLKRQDSSFDLRGFQKDINLGELKFGARIKQVADALDRHLPRNFKKSADMLVNSLPSAIPESQAGTTFADHFIVMPMGEYIARNGLEHRHFEVSMKALRAMTKSFSSENAVRPFLETYPDRTLAYLLDCAKDPNVHVRRWASEGSRPRLPLAKRIQAFISDPRPVFPILETLKNDSHLYVRRSVANSLNDISKDHPDMLVQLLSHWRKNPTAERLWIIRHALRTLAKKAHPKALELLGYGRCHVEVKDFRWTKAVSLGSDLEFSFSLENLGFDSSLLVDYVIVFKKEKKPSEKVFKLKKFFLKKNERVALTGKRHLDHFSTRKMYLGQHKIILQINGQRFAEGAFMVRDSLKSL